MCFLALYDFSGMFREDLECVVLGESEGEREDGGKRRLGNVPTKTFLLWGDIVQIYFLK